MDFKNILITGGAGFVGSNIALKLKEFYPDTNVVALDNLKRRGSELNVPRLHGAGVVFEHGDVRNKEDLQCREKVDLIIECSAEPSVLAGVGESPEYLINTNLIGALNCLELARRHNAGIIFLSTSRVYPIKELNDIRYQETASRFELSDAQDLPGVSARGVSEDFPLGKTRSLYGATKLAAEIFIQEYIDNYKIRGVINRCGVIAGPWQMGKIDQGVAVLWMAAHEFGRPLSYIGFEGAGKQVRDFLHIDDLFDALDIQIKNFDKFNAEIYNLGGGVKNSFSLLELTAICEKLTGRKIDIKSVSENRPNDVRIYISDAAKFSNLTGWQCRRGAEDIMADIYKWLVDNRSSLEKIF